LNSYGIKVYTRSIVPLAFDTLFGTSVPES